MQYILLVQFYNFFTITYKSYYRSCSVRITRHKYVAYHNTRYSGACFSLAWSVPSLFAGASTSLSLTRTHTIFLSNSILHMTSGYPSTACYHGFIGTVPPLSLTLTHLISLLISQ